MGGDEFVLVVPGIEDSGAEEIVHRLQATVAEASAAGGDGIAVTVSVGYAFYPNHGQDAEELLVEADRRMYSVKNSRRAMPEATELAKAAASSV
jgi:diguanylate cyclase (GGDEF)-like protein